MSMRLLFLGLTLVACNGDDTDSEDPGAAIYTSSWSYLYNMLCTSDRI